MDNLISHVSASAEKGPSRWKSNKDLHYLRDGPASIFPSTHGTIPFTARRHRREVPLAIDHQLVQI